MLQRKLVNAFIISRTYLRNWQSWPATLQLIAFMFCSTLVYFLYMPIGAVGINGWNALWLNITEPFVWVILCYLSVSGIYSVLYALYAARLWAVTK